MLHETFASLKISGGRGMFFDFLLKYFPRYAYLDQDQNSFLIEKLSHI